MTYYPFRLLKRLKHRNTGPMTEALCQAQQTDYHAKNEKFRELISNLLLSFTEGYIFTLCTHCYFFQQYICNNNR